MSEIPIQIYNALQQIATGNLLPWNRVFDLSAITHPSEQPKIQLTIHRINEYYQTTQKQSSSMHFIDESFWVI
jgi:hypothetical protein